MDTQIIVALIIAVPVVLIPLALLWQLNVAGIRGLFHGENRHKSTR